MGKLKHMAMKIIVPGRLGPNFGVYFFFLFFSLNPNGLGRIKVPLNPGFQPQDPHFLEAHTVGIYNISRVKNK